MAGHGFPFKTYIDFVEMVRECSNCFEVLPFKNFSLNANSKPRSRCKACRSKIVRQREMEKKLAEHPEKYSQCEDCYYIFTKNKRKVGRPCPKCGGKCDVE